MIKQIKQQSKKIWDFLWKSDSLASWIVSLILAFIIIKFIFFPLLSLILGSSMPLVVVESTSMHHPGNFIGNTIGSEHSFESWWKEKGEWYSNNGINKQDAKEWNLNSGLEMGDIVVVGKADNLKIGDIIIFQANRKYPIIHRIVEIKNIQGQKVYSTKGDNNSRQLTSEKNITKKDIIGKALIKIPKIGWTKLGIVKFFELF